MDARQRKACRADLVRAVADLDEQRALTLVRQRLARGQPAYAIIEEFQRGMRLVGKRYEAGRYFLAGLIIAGEIFKRIFAEIRPYLGTPAGTRLGRVVIGTVFGDIHDIGKNLVAATLEVGGFEVIDIGVDASPELFVEEARRYQADIVAVSAAISTTMLNIPMVVAALRHSRISPPPRVIVGGAPLTRRYALSIGADGYGADAFEALDWARRMMASPRAAREAQAIGPACR